jgi:hypothetical protein
MYYFTESHFRYFKENLTEGQRTFSRIAEKDINTKFDIFISYNINDKAIIRGVYNELTEMGFKVYVDFIIDTTLNRNNVTLETAKKIRARLENSKSLIYAQSPNAAMSRWMPWELGVVDGHTKKCAILPIFSSSTSNYSKQEYLKLYPVIKPSSIYHMLVYREVNGIESPIQLSTFII